MNKFVYGVGINDADYVVQIKETIGYKENGKILQKQIWICPFYSKWKGMLQRCYAEKFLMKNPTYSGCYVTPEWHYFMTFRAWMIEQDWENKELDKDLLLNGNKAYGPENCLFLDQKVNKFMNEREKSRGSCPIGVSFHKLAGKFTAQCKDTVTGKLKHLGYYSCPDEAHMVWLTEKRRQAKLLAAEQTDLRVAEALIKRYENYTRI